MKNEKLKNRHAFRVTPLFKRGWTPLFAFLIFNFSFAQAADLGRWQPSSSLPPASSGIDREPSATVMTSDPLEEGKALYEQGQYMQALSKFMAVLRRDPRQPEARQYLKLVIESLRKNPGATSSQDAVTGPGPAAYLEEQVRQRVRQRSLLTLDLKAIPGVFVTTDKTIQLSIDSNLLFTDKAGALKEGAVPVLDRVAAWLRTFNQLPIIIHAYPEEFEDASTNDGLFLRRYAELYGFFVEERKLPPARFISGDLLGVDDKNENQNNDIKLPKSRIVIEVPGSTGARLDFGAGAMVGSARTRWLELSILSSRTLFNPEEGEWASLDLAALTRSGLRSWSFKIVPITASDKPIFMAEGQGNLLMRLSWDGRDAKSGSLLPSGNYLARLIATDSDGSTNQRELPLQIQRTMTEETSSIVPKKRGPSKKKKAKAVVKAAAPVEPASAPVEESGSPVQAIWKQVIDFDAGQSDLKPTIKSSLERISKTLAVYPRQKVQIVGFADTGEADAATLARSRAEKVRNILVNEYQVDPERVTVAGGKTEAPRADGGSHKVELSIVN